MDQLVRINLLAKHRLRDANGLFSGRSRRKSSINTLGEACAIAADPWCNLFNPCRAVEGDGVGWRQITASLAEEVE